MEVRVQLKICEGCGCLWFRAQTQGSVYCRECESKAERFSIAGKSQAARTSAAASNFPEFGRWLRQQEVCNERSLPVANGMGAQYC